MTRRVAVILAAFAAILLLATALAPRGGPSLAGAVPSYSSTDASPGGVLALRRWIAALGYGTVSVQGQRFAVPPEADLLFVLAPLEIVSAEDARTLREWVGRGHVLVVASDRGLFDDELFNAFGAHLETRGAGAIEGTFSPVLAHPDVAALSTSTARELVLDDAATVLVGDGPRAVVAMRRVGRGFVFLSSAPDTLSNGAIGSAANDRLVLNFLTWIRRGAVVAFDEYHHGSHVEADAPGLIAGTGPGRALAFVAVVVFLYVALRGRRLGPPVALEERPPRSSLDYVRSFAALLRRSRARDLARERLARSYRRRLARGVGLPLNASEDEVVAALARMSRERGERARALFASLSSRLREQDLLASVSDAERLVTEVGAP